MGASDDRSHTWRTLWKAALWLTLAALVLAVAGGGCRGRIDAEPASAEDRAWDDSETRAEAYSFNARLKRDGKPTTIKLELYHADTVIGLAGRAYLGKGALKGRLTADSLVVYFPSTNEYVSEALADLGNASDCPVPLSQLRLLDLFRLLPDSAGLPSEVTAAGNYQDEDEPRFVVFVEDCPWQVELEYRRRDPGWRPKKFEFDDGDRISLRAELERYKAEAGVKNQRFVVRIPPDATRLIP